MSNDAQYRFYQRLQCIGIGNRERGFKVLANENQSPLRRLIYQEKRPYKRMVCLWAAMFHPCGSSQGSSQWEILISNKGYTMQERYLLRRADRTITDRAVLISHLQSAPVGRVGVIADGEPYVVPMNFAYACEDEQTWGRLIIHGASQGRLIRALSNQPPVCLEVDEFIATLPDPVLCEYSTAYVSIMCFGQARILDALEERTRALRILAQKYAPAKAANALKEKTVEKFRGRFDAHTAVMEIVIHNITGKYHPMDDAT